MLVHFNKKEHHDSSPALSGLYLGLAVQAQDGRCLTGDCQEGYGHFQWHSGDQYWGNFHQGQMDGYGVFYWVKGRKYIGNWSRGKLHGEGVLLEPNGQTKRGRWQRNRFVELYRSEHQLTAAALAHGRTQLQRILTDRPAMAKLVQPNDPIGQWVILQLAGAQSHALVHWQPQASADFHIPEGVAAVHAYATPTSTAKIWVRPSQDAEQLWASLIYELHNLHHGAAFRQITLDAQQFRCDEQEYIMRHARLEYQAGRATADFYRNHWQPFCQSKSKPTTPQRWFYYLPTTFERWTQTFTDPKGYPWHPYKAYYPRLIRSVQNRY